MGICIAGDEHYIANASQTYPVTYLVLTVGPPESATPTLHGDADARRRKLAPSRPPPLSSPAGVVPH